MGNPSSGSKPSSSGAVVWSNSRVKSVATHCCRSSFAPLRRSPADNTIKGGRADQSRLDDEAAEEDEGPLGDQLSSPANDSSALSGQKK